MNENKTGDKRNVVIDILLCIICLLLGLGIGYIVFDHFNTETKSDSVVFNIDHNAG